MDRKRQTHDFCKKNFWWKSILESETHDVVKNTWKWKEMKMKKGSTEWARLILSLMNIVN